MKHLFHLRPATLLAGILFAVALLTTSCSETPVDEAPTPSKQDAITPGTRVGEVMTLEDNGITMHIFDWTKEIYSCQRVTFRITIGNMTMYGDDKVKIEITDLADNQSIPFSYDPGMTNYYFFAASAPGCNVKVTLVDNPEVSGNFFIPTRPGGIFLKQVTIERYPYYDPTYEIGNHTVQFFADKACTQQVSAPRDMYIRVHLFKVAADLFPTSGHIYRDETVYLTEGREDACNNRLVTVHEHLPSGAMLDDYYEIEFIRFIKQ